MGHRNRKHVCAVLDAHRVESSAAIIIALAIILSPYLLIALVVLILIVGVPNLPSFLRPLLPAPVVQVTFRVLNAVPCIAVRLVLSKAPHVQ